MFGHRVDRAIGILLLVIVLVALGHSWQVSRSVQRQQDHLTTYVHCQAEWNGFLQRALVSSRQATGEAQAALDELIRTVAEASSADETRAALAKYREARSKQIANQTQDPLPDPPKEVCG